MKHIRPAWRCGRLFGILRGNDGAVRQSLLYGIPLLLASALALFSASDFERASESDYDSDGMTDAYELFFGLNPTNSADAYLDYDGDRFSNLRESALLTDPFEPDTDRDEFGDDVDANPISRAYIQWGAPQFTTGDQYDYAHPDWFLRAYKSGGEWVVDPAMTQSCWRASGDECDGVAGLAIDLDRTILTNNLRYAVHYSFGRAGQPVPPFDSVEQGCSNMPSLYVDLLDTNGTVLVEDLCGNLMTAGKQVGGLDYAAVGMAIRRFEIYCRREKQLCRIREKLKRDLMV